MENPMTNLEASALDYARRQERAYIAKRGGSVPIAAALNVFMWAYNRFLSNPERFA